MNLDVCIVYVCILYKKSDAFGDNIDPFDEKLNTIKRYIQICLLEQGMTLNLA